MGLERVAYLLQGMDNMYEIDEVFPVIERASELSGRRYGARPRQDDVRFRVVADHVRSALMLIGDGVTPGNEGRGYVLRRLLRRAVRSMRLLGVEDRVLPELLPVSRDAMKASYPELELQWERISTVAYAEEDAFRARWGPARRSSTSRWARRKQSGATVAVAATGRSHCTTPTASRSTSPSRWRPSRGSASTRTGFRRLMAQQRERAKADAKAKKTKHGEAHHYRALADKLGRAVEFTGYDEVVSEATVARHPGRARARADRRSEGEEVELVLDRTPFYAEGGGQLADQGVIRARQRRRGRGPRRAVADHAGSSCTRRRSSAARSPVGEPAHALVDVERRRSISRAHTATHMVHKAFREALGDTATQAGSENAPGRFRFDFSATGAVPTSVLPTSRRGSTTSCSPTCRCTRRS